MKKSAQAQAFADFLLLKFIRMDSINFLMENS